MRGTSIKQFFNIFGHMCSVPTTYVLLMLTSDPHNAPTFVFMLYLMPI